MPDGLVIPNQSSRAFADRINAHRNVRIITRKIDAFAENQF